MYGIFTMKLSVFLIYKCEYTEIPFGKNIPSAVGEHRGILQFEIGRRVWMFGQTEIVFEVETMV